MDEKKINEICNKWDIVKEIAKKEQSPLELSKKLETSISNIIQQLKVLEAYNIVGKKKSDEKNIGKPKTIYYIKEESAYILLLKNNNPEKKIFRIEGFNSILYTILFLSPEDTFYMLKFLLKYDDIIKKCKAIGLIKTTKDTIEFIIITDYVDEIRAKFSNLFIEDNYGKTKKIVNWTHNESEINDGFNRKEKYFLELLNNTKPIYDESKILEKYIDWRKRI
ncbi:MAG: winged helix-turn-helix domain-containing protein [Candidatus Woesearchaeota archaeon]